MFNRLVFATILTMGLVACGDASDQNAGNEEIFTGIQLTLTTQGVSGVEYRLSPATFSIQAEGSSNPPQLVDASADAAAVVNTPAEPGSYTVTLQSGWALNRVLASGSLEPIPATLTSPASRTVVVDPFETEPVSFQFHLGQASIAIGATVDEGDYYVGYDGYITQAQPGVYSIQFNGTFPAACCFSSVEEARAAYPGLNLQAP